MSTTHDPQTVIDAAIMPPSMVATMIATYHDLAEESYRLGQHDRAAYCLERAEALAYGGSILLEAAS
jgi:hypothetical protein